MKALLIDGYNLLHQLDVEGSFEEKREQLFKLLAHYAAKKEVQIHLVLDSKEDSGVLTERDRRGRLEILYSKSYPSADEHIRSICKSKPGQFIVVSSDREVMRAAEETEQTSIPSQDFAKRLMSQKNHKPQEPIPSDDFEDLEDELPLYPQINTQKRGNPKKASKKDRKRQQILKKL